jgi:hypothetical protein
LNRAPEKDSLTTRQLELIAYNYLYKQGTYLCREVSMPTEYRGALVKERVDMLSYDTKGIWRFYEFKISVSDFHSHNNNTFYGNFNYYVLPMRVYQIVHDEIPKNIGVFLCNKEKFTLKCIRRAAHQELGVNEEELKFNFMQALSRDNTKRYRKDFWNMHDAALQESSGIAQLTDTSCVI